MAGTTDSIRLIASVVGFYKCYVMGSTGGSHRIMTYYGLISLLMMGNLIIGVSGARVVWYNRLGLLLNPASVVMAGMIPGDGSVLTQVFRGLVMFDGVIYMLANIVLWSTLIFGSNCNGGVEELIIKFMINRETVNRMRVKVGNEAVE